MPTLDQSELTEDSLLRFADLALYEAKARGRNRVAVFDNDLAEAADTASRQRDLLRSVLAEDRLVMHYQPLVDGTTDEIIGFESLARFRTRSGDVLGPGEFLEAASGTGLVWELDRAPSSSPVTQLRRSRHGARGSRSRATSHHWASFNPSSSSTSNGRFGIDRSSRR